MVGYVLLISVAVILGVIVYQSLKTYVPIEPPTCPEETSIFIQGYECGDLRDLNVTIQNNGRFALTGYYIHISNAADADIATFDLSTNVVSGGMSAGGAVVFVTSADNPISPGDEVKTSFNLNGFLGEITLIEIIPARFQEIEGKTTFVSCGNAKVQERITGCIIEDCIDTDGGYERETPGTCIDTYGILEDECEGIPGIQEAVCSLGSCGPSYAACTYNPPGPIGPNCVEGPPAYCMSDPGES